MTSRLPNHLKHHRRGLGRVPQARSAGGVLHRGVIVGAYRPLDPNLTGKVAKPTAVAGVLCDVQILDHSANTILRNVPTVVQSAGLNDYEEWNPQIASQGITIPLVQDTTDSPAPTKAEDMVGDYVVIAYLNNDINQPVIIGQLPHPKTNCKPTAIDATLYKWRRHLRGLKIGVTSGGDIELDLSVPADGALSVDGAYVPAAAGGNVTLIMKPGATVEVQKLVGSATEAVILGETFVADLKNSITELQTAINGLGIPTPNTLTFLAAITTSLSAGLPYLSSHVKVD